MPARPSWSWSRSTSPRSRGGCADDPMLRARASRCRSTTATSPAVVEADTAPHRPHRAQPAGQCREVQQVRRRRGVRGAERRGVVAVGPRLRRRAGAATRTCGCSTGSGAPTRPGCQGGTGLGLPIAREDAVLHGGTLQAWGRPGEGSRVHPDDPQARPARRPARPGLGAGPMTPRAAVRVLAASRPGARRRVCGHPDVRSGHRGRGRLRLRAEHGAVLAGAARGRRHARRGRPRLPRRDAGLPRSTRTAAAFLTPDGGRLVGAPGRGDDLHAVQVATPPEDGGPAPTRATATGALDARRGRPARRAGPLSRPARGRGASTTDCEQVDGQWRIANPQPGLMVTDKFFDDYFRPFDLYFFDRRPGGWSPSRCTCWSRTGWRPR